MYTCIEQKKEMKDIIIMIKYNYVSQVLSRVISFLLPFMFKVMGHDKK